MSGLVTGASALLLLPVALATAPDSFPSLGPVAAVLTLGLLGTGFAFVVFFWLISTVGPARAWIVSYVAPGFAIAYGAVFLSEEITVATIGGLALILAGSWLSIEGRLPGGRRRWGREDLAPSPVSE
jgi:drug/metabolite transporter (DMT)-like permease